MKGLFDRTDELIAQALGLKDGQTLKQKSTCMGLEFSPETLYAIENLVFELFARLEENWEDRLPSPMNWQLRCKTELSPRNQSPEVLLERAIVILSERGLLDGWHNQLPIASGLIDDKSNKRAAVDLVWTDNEHAELVELKWESDNPAYAAFEILRYGLAFLFCHMKREDFSYHNYQLMNVKKLTLRVLAPHGYYDYCHLGALARAIATGLQKLYQDKTGGNIKSEFVFSAFPPDFSLPFRTGEEVTAMETLPEDAEPIRVLLDAVQNIQPIWEEDGK